LLIWLIYSRVDRYLLAARVDEKQRESRELDDQIAQAKDLRKNTAKIAQWADEDVVWLDRLVTLNRNLPSSRDAYLRELKANNNRPGGQMELNGAVRRQDDIARLGERLAAEGFSLNVTKRWEDRSVSPYTWSFEASVSPNSSSGTGHTAASGGTPPASGSPAPDTTGGTRSVPDTTGGTRSVPDTKGVPDTKDGTRVTSNQLPGQGVELP
jgi:hypothetical protein